MIPRYKTPDFQKQVLKLAFFGSALAFAIGLIESPVVVKDRWPWLLAWQTILLLIVSWAGTALALFLIRIRNLSGLWFSGFILIAVFIATFGAASFFGGLIVLACCFLAGHILFAVTGFRLASITDILVVGIAFLILLLTGVSVLQINMIEVFWMIIAVCFAAPFVFPTLHERVIENLKDLKNAVRLKSSQETSLVTLSLIVFSLLFYAAQAALPERFFDAMVMHLMVPTQILMHGRWPFDLTLYPSFAFSPLGTDYMYSFAMALGGEMGAKFFNWLLLVVILAQLYSLARDLCGARIAQYAVLFFLAIPTALIVTSSLFVENMLALLAVTSVKFLLMQKTRDQRSALIGLAIILGALCAVKFHGLFIVAPVALIAILNLKNGKLTRKDWGILLSIAAISAALGLLPYIFAWWETGNPIFPLQNALFRSPFWPPENQIDGRWMGRLSPLLLYNMTFRSNDYMEANNGAMGFAFILLLLPGIVACCFRPRRATTIILIVAFTYAALLFSQNQYIRYLYAIFPLLVLICAAGLERIAALQIRRLTLSTLALPIILFGFYKLPSGGWTLSSANFMAIYDTGQREELLKGPAPERLANEMLNMMAVAPRVVYAANPYGALLRGVPIYTDWHNKKLNMDLTAAQKTEDVKMIIEAQKPDFIIATRNAESEIDKKILSYAQSNATRIADIGSLEIFRLRPF